MSVIFNVCQFIMSHAIAAIVLLLISQRLVDGGRSFAVTLRNKEATQVAESYGLVNRGRVLENVYWFEEVSSVTRGEFSQQLLKEDPSVRKHYRVSVSR